MQEPVRLNLLNVLQRSLKIAGKKTYLHRLIYIGNYAVSGPQDSRLFQLLLESNIKLVNDDYCEEPLTGFGLFYSGYFIIIMEGAEDTLNKHLKTLVNSFDENPSIPKVNKMKVLLVTHHINKRFFSSWFGRPAKPPVLLEKIEHTSSLEENRRHIQNCVMKLYRMSEYLRSQPAGLVRATIDNISELCQQYLPEFNLLDFLLSSPALLDLREYIGLYGSITEVKFYEEVVWPCPPDFVPYDVIGEDRTKKLIYTPTEEENSVTEAGNKKET